MNDGRKYRISRWSVFALLIVPIAVFASVVVVAVLEEPGSQVEGIRQLAAEMVRKVGAVPAQ